MSLASLLGLGTTGSQVDLGNAASRLAALEARTGRIPSGVQIEADERRAEASATVTLSGEAMHALETIGKGAVDAAEAVVEWPLEMARDAVEGVGGMVGSVVGEGWNLLKGAARTIVSDVESLAHEVVIDIPSALASGAGSVATTAMNAVASVAGDAVQVAAFVGPGGAKLIDAII